MEIKRLVKFTVLGAVLFIVIAFGAMGFVMYDVMSYTATSSQTLSPGGTEIGKALVVYDPGISGQAENAAQEIAKNLQGKGYTVDLVGISNENAKNNSQYNIIIVGGPIYAGKASKSVESYLSDLKPDSVAKVAVFAIGQDADILNNKEFLLKEVAPLPQSSTLKITSVTKFINVTNEKSASFVDSILK
ncbi:flavodoxin family protein [Methanobacterium oryzae]|uniref:flavodoxin family protein n=1 Tax=Methanobacterium oryzae TaxID=69540 RepID=UPI003D206AD5